MNNGGHSLKIVLLGVGSFLEIGSDGAKTIQNILAEGSNRSGRGVESAEQSGLSGTVENVIKNN